MRPGHLFFLILFLFLVVDSLLYLDSRQYLLERESVSSKTDILVSSFGLSDLCISTEARYTRHPAVTDPVSPFMDYPGAIEHFPSGSFWGVPGQIRGIPGGEE